MLRLFKNNLSLNNTFCVKVVSSEYSYLEEGIY